MGKLTSRAEKRIKKVTTKLLSSPVMDGDTSEVPQKQVAYLKLVKK